MKLRNIFKSRDKPRNSTPGQYYSFLFGGSSSGKNVNERSAMQMTAVYACVRILSEAVAGLPLHLYRYGDKGTKEKAIDHPLYHLLLDEPNPEMTSFIFRETLMTHLLLWGNAYAQIIRNGKGEVIALYPLMPNRMRVDRDSSGNLFYEYTRTSDDALSKGCSFVVLKASDVLHIPGLGFDGLVGYSPIAMARNAIGLAMATEEYGAKFFANGAQPGGVLEHPGIIKDPARVRESCNSVYQDSGNSHRIAVLEEGMKYTPIGIAPNEAQFLETRKFQIDEIARIFRVPPHMVGDLEKSSFSNIEQQSLEFVKYTLDPWVIRWEQNLAKALFSEEEKKDYRKSDNLYTFRYKDVRGKVKAIYNSDLKELRKKEEEILKIIDDRIDYASGMITVIGLVEKYVSLKEGVRHNTKVGYKFVLNILKKEDFGYLKIFDIKPSDAQKWFIQLHKDGKGYSTLTSIRGVLKPAFQMAFEEDIIRRNPFDFVITKYVPNDSKHREALTDTEQKMWMDFIRTDKTYCKYYDEFVVLLGTGMRVSEFCGLTVKDLDFKKRRINVDHQLIRDSGGRYYIEKTKTECGRRSIPMTNDVYEALKKILKSRPKNRSKVIIDGYADFLMYDKNGNPKIALHIENECRWAQKKYDTLHPKNPIAKITPHVYRHTFCTNMVNIGMDAKVLQYIMGHSEIDVTMNIYTHMGLEHASSQMLRLVDGTGESKKTRYEVV